MTPEIVPTDEDGRQLRRARLLPCCGMENLTRKRWLPALLLAAALVAHLFMLNSHEPVGVASVAASHMATGTDVAGAPGHDQTAMVAGCVVVVLGIFGWRLRSTAEPRRNRLLLESTRPIQTAFAILDRPLPRLRSPVAEQVVLQV